VGDPKGYMRHLLYIDPKESFVITAITWLPGQVSAVHGHHVWCMYGIAEGELTEDQFTDDLSVSRTRVYRPGDLADHDLEQKAIHRVANRGRERVVSLHLYGIAVDHLTTGINRVYRT
jgi:predicted metal-dependent enzyme (double-stranded beta helix superfamily)